MLYLSHIRFYISEFLEVSVLLRVVLNDNIYIYACNVTQEEIVDETDEFVDVHKRYFFQVLKNKLLYI